MLKFLLANRFVLTLLLLVGIFAYLIMRRLRQPGGGAYCRARVKRTVTDFLGQGFHKDGMIMIGLYAFGLIVGYHIPSILIDPSINAHPLPRYIPSSILPYFSHLKPDWQYAHLLAVTLMPLYGIFRVGMGRILSVFLTLMVATSPLQLHILTIAPGQDFSRAIFVFSLIFLIVQLALNGTGIVKVLLISALFGLFYGWGVRVRFDIILFFGLFVLVTLCFLPGSIRSTLKLGALAIPAAVFFFGLVSARPTLRLDSRLMYVGMTTVQNKQVRISHPSYDIGYLYLDEYLADVVKMQFKRDPNETRSTAVYEQLLSNYPADWGAQFFGAAHRILEAPFSYELPPSGISNWLILALFSVRSWIVHLLSGSGIFIFAATLFVLACQSIRLSLLYLIVCAFVGALLANVFLGKHYFYSEFISWWSLGFLLHKASLAFRTAFGRWQLLRQARWLPTGRQLLPGLILISAVTLSVPLCMVAIRHYQNHHLTYLFQTYLKAPKSPPQSRAASLEGGIVSVARPPKDTVREHSIEGAEFLVAEFGGSRCGYSTLWPTLRYRAQPETRSRLDWSRVIRVSVPPGGSGRVQYFFPAFENFVGIELPEEQAECLMGISRILNPSELPVFVTGEVPPAEPGLFARLDTWERSRIRSSSGRSVSRKEIHEWGKREVSLSPSDVRFQAPMVTTEGPTWVIRGIAVPPEYPLSFPIYGRKTQSRLASIWVPAAEVARVDSDLLIAKTRQVKKGSQLLIQGSLAIGGLTLGLTKNGRPAGIVEITVPGEFTAVLEVESDGAYEFGIANNLSYYEPIENRATVSKIAWIDPP